MPTGQPDRFSPQERSDVEGSAGGAGEGMSPADAVEMTADRIIRESIEAGDFNDLPGSGRPIPGAGTVDDEMWWVRSWLERNRESSNQDSNNSE